MRLSGISRLTLPLIMAELTFDLRVLMQHCFFHIILDVSISKPTFGPLCLSVVLYPLIDFPLRMGPGSIESQKASIVSICLAQ